MVAMRQLRAHLSWLFRGHLHVGNAIEGLSRDLRELQQKVGELDVRITEVSIQLAKTNAEQIKHLSAARNACDTATDDLAERIAALHARLP
jgi:chromosome segregation ATPase